MRYSVSILISPRKDILDPQGKAVEQALANLGYGGATGVRVGKYICFDFESGDGDSVSVQVDDMCRKLLANPIVEDYAIELTAL